MQERFVTIFADMQLVPSLLFNSDFSAPILMKMASLYLITKMAYIISHVGARGQWWYASNADYPNAYLD